MPVHSVLLLNAQDKVLFSKHLDPEWRLAGRADDRVQWARVLFRKTRLKPALATNTPQFFQEGRITVVFQGFNDVVFFLAGTDECDEMILTDLIGVVQELFCLACGGRKKLSAGGASAEHEFLHKDGGAFAKFSIYLDQMLPDGVVASLNIDLIDRMAKSKPVV